MVGNRQQHMHRLPRHTSGTPELLPQVRQQPAVEVARANRRRDAADGECRWGTQERCCQQRHDENLVRRLETKEADCLAEGRMPPFCAPPSALSALTDGSYLTESMNWLPRLSSDA